MFGDEDAIGKDIIVEENLTETTYRVIGIVADVSYATPDTYGHVWLPHPSLYKNEPGSGVIVREEWTGNRPAVSYILAPSVSQMEPIITEINEIVQRLNSVEPAENAPKATLDLVGEPLPYWKTELRETFSPIRSAFSAVPFAWKEILKVLLPMLLAMLLVPAINMAGMVASMMEERLAEFGVRKVFGASRRRLMGQILAENFLLTLIGGVVGLVMSYLVMYFGSNWVMTLFDKEGVLTPDGAVTFYTVDMLFNPLLFAAALLLCFLLNYISAVIPARHALRKDIVYSLNKKR
jgi:hypothetical protein